MAFKFRGFRERTEVSCIKYILRRRRRRSLVLIENFRHQTHIDYNLQNIISFRLVVQFKYAEWLTLEHVFFLSSYFGQMEDT